MSVKETVTFVNQDVVHQPDYQFASWCLRQYGVNKGIYNTIDERLFNLGLKDIVTRRMTIISFLAQVQQSNPHDDNGKKLNLGKDFSWLHLLGFYFRKPS
ncbi:hypothetical protein DNHGIG_24660 [Collibacillus ludicampi]|uniref:Uncharacterized protein n=1 Tax=Collibacillus ludicampi TaxID=2771369 RepID=A0AAV4LHL5_9BACL|nr:RNA-binding protein [Collibacillus ludicampi]GIM46917.1 hypothetical protein DNHGIG_24660 [Collibacillus ludicampi]